jgi:hypothetical protein
MKIPCGSEWIAPISSLRSDKNGVEGYIEEEGFEGDCVLANAEVFLQEFGWWIVADYCIPEGAVGSLLEVFKIWIFMTAGSGNHNYTTYLLDFYCLLHYKSSLSLQKTIELNLLVNIKGIPGHFD